MRIEGVAVSVIHDPVIIIFDGFVTYIIGLITTQNFINQKSINGKMERKAGFEPAFRLWKSRNLPY